MSAGGPTRAEIPPDTRPSALALHGFRRGTLLVFLPVALAGQALAWAGYLISGAYGPVSWLKIGFAYALTSVRVPFEVTQRDLGGPEAARTETMEVALGALTVAVVVLAFRAGRDQARGLERRPLAAAASGAVVGVGFAVPSLLIAVPVRLAFPGVGLASVRPVLWAAFAVPLVVGSAIGAAGGLAASRERLEVSTWGERVVAGVRGGTTALWTGLALAFLVFLLVAAVQTGVTRAYGRAMGGAGAGGAVAVVHHALLLPNQSAMVLSASMGSPVEFTAGTRGATIGIAGIDRTGEGSLLFGLIGLDEGRLGLPAWFWVFLAVPLVATIAGGRRAGEGARSPLARTASGALAGAVYALGVTLTAWAATLVVPVLTALFGGPARLGPDLGRTFVLALAWGLAGCSAGALVSPRRPR